MAAIYFFIWAAFVWSCKSSVVSAINNLCPSVCSCLGDYVDCSRTGLIEIPKDLPTWVTDLEIQSNAISSLNPEDFKGLHKLQKIDLSNNEISFINESVFVNLPSLKEIKINNNKLTEIPVLKGNPVLTRLELTHNKIHTINGNALKHLPQLDMLDLSYNDITDITNATFPANLSITKLFLRNNEIIYFEAGCFYNLTKLETLKLNKNKISHLPKDLFIKLVNLKSLDLSKNQLSRLMGLTFKGLRSLQLLKIRKNMIHTLEDGVFFGLDRLQNLQLDENNLTTISQNWLYGLENLKELSVSNNKVFKIEPKAWEYAPHVVTLDVRSNAMVTVETDSLQRLSSLKSLLLADNQVEIIQEGAFKHLEALEELDLNHNRISSTIEDVNGAFTGLVRLKKLSLINNKIKTITKQAFTGLESVEVLLLDSNNITSIQGNSFEPLIQLRQLSFNTTSLFCDCQLSWVPIWLRDNNFEHSVIAKCAHPSNVKGKSIFVVDSSEFKCDGQFLKPEIFLNPKTQVVLKGDNITLNCSAASTEAQGSPTHFQWRKDDFVLSDVKTEDYAVRSGNLTHYTSKLHISNAQDVDAGKYHCVISNDYGSAYSKRANINVYVFPKFTKRPQNVTAKARTEATLVCAAEGQPKPTITWQKDGGFDHFPAAQERRMHVIPEDDHFYIVDVKAADEGIYSCIAKNEAGTIVANVTLTVLQTPSFVRPMEPKETRVGTTTVMECLAQGSPQPKLTWYHDGEPLVLSQRHFFTAEDRLLVIVETKTSDAGEYTCEMSNTLGTIRGTSTLTVVTGASRGDREERNESSGGGLDDESTTTGIIIIAVVCCVVGTSLVWVIIIYQTRKRQELYSATPTDETTLPGEVPSSGYMSSDKEGSYTHGIPVTSLPAYQYHEMQMKESGYESSSGRFRAARSAAIFPSDVDQDELHSYNMLAGDGRYLEQSDENSLSSQEYPQSESDSLKSDGHSVNSSHSSQQQILTTFHPHAASQERLGTTRSRSCSVNQIPCDNNINTDADTVQCENTNKDNSVSSQTDDTLGDSCLPSYKEIIHPNVNSRCRKCGEESSHADVHECKHNNPPVPPKPSRWRHTRHKGHSHFDRAQPPGISRSSSDIQDYMYEEDIPPPPPPPLVPCSGVFVRPEYSGDEGVYLTNGSPYVPYFHPVNAPCDCHLHYAPPPTHKHSRDHRQHTSKDVATNNFSVPHNQRLNGVVGCVHHHIGAVNPAWQGHAYTLPYMPTHQVPQMHAAPTKVSPRQQQTHHSAPRHRETSAGQKLSKSPNVNSPKTDSSNS
ncbi:leucine-rich repeats and immunoglobulin-like domains protein 2 [Mercenaria mercenaria]|uniref:leucine-rich repeats and immunoglobulin-like domains protein 2 n=1 Tax=Mercenaria mercenaria TaxID=6596 RepID=UPI00234F3ED4|nr:leucine-rich repeats and immunoglobulin-like domains protein 2 [Mercenaria mercenaria]